MAIQKEWNRNNTEIIPKYWKIINIHLYDGNSNNGTIELSGYGSKESSDNNKTPIEPNLQVSITNLPIEVIQQVKALIYPILIEQYEPFNNGIEI